MKKHTGTVILLAMLVIIFTVPVYAAKINRKKVTITVGNTVKLKVTGVRGKIKWNSSNKKVAIVSSKGKVKGKKAGRAIITAKVGSKKYICKVVVKEASLATAQSKASEVPPITPETSVLPVIPETPTVPVTQNEDPVCIKLPSYPFVYNIYAGSVVDQRYTITNISCTPPEKTFTGNYLVTIKITGKKEYDRLGAGRGNPMIIYWRLKKGNTVIKKGVESTLTLVTENMYADVMVNAFDVDEGSYVLEIYEN